MKQFIVGLLLITFSLTSFGQTSTSEESSDPDNLAKEYFSQIMGVATSAASTTTKLYQFVYDWLGTPYRLGGSSKNGIDCSKFSLALYENVFNTQIGFNSRNQYSKTMPVKKADLQAGDLVFFKIKSKNITHVGVYLGDDKFAHASSSRGVMISNLNEDYWRRYYFSGGRPNNVEPKKAPRILTADLNEALDNNLN